MILRLIQSRRINDEVAPAQAVILVASLLTELKQKLLGFVKQLLPIDFYQCLGVSASVSWCLQQRILRKHCFGTTHFNTHETEANQIARLLKMRTVEPHYNECCFNKIYATTKYFQFPISHP